MFSVFLPGQMMISDVTIENHDFRLRLVKTMLGFHPAGNYPINGSLKWKESNSLITSRLR